MKLPIFQAEKKVFEQLLKVKEEAEEVIESYRLIESRERKISEVFDLIQAAENLLYMDFSELEIEKGAREHLVKMQERVKTRGYEIKRYIEIKNVEIKGERIYE